MVSGDGLSVVNDIRKSEEDKRLYRALQLQNRMKVLLVSDPTTDKSAAALDVHVGHMSDPKDLPGLAHFCEHMLFLGTEKYPVENEYNKFLSEHNGCSNAYTDSDHTNYFFEVAPEHLPGALDRFAQFFLSPLFTECATEREVNAVNSEHENNVQSDYWRVTQLARSLANPEHDFCRFNTGNKETLDTIPKSRNIVTRDELLKFHSKWYSANIMALCILGKDSLDELQSLVVNLFSDVIDKNVAIPEWPEHPYGPDQLKMMYNVIPVQDIRQLNITFPLPDLHPYYKTDPGNYLGHLVGHEGPGSLLSTLKSKGWVNNLTAGHFPGVKGFSFFAISQDLTEEGIEHVDDIVTLVFEYMKMLRNEGTQEWFFQECQHLDAVAFRFKDKERPEGYVLTLASCLHYYPLEEVLCGPSLMEEYQPDLIEMVLSKLIPDKIHVMVVGKKFEGQTDAIEPWYGTHYSMKPIPEETIKQWCDVDLNENLHLPPRNEFIPTIFDLAPREEASTQLPLLVKNTSLSKVWFLQDQEFLLPKAILNFQLSSPLAYMDPIHCNFAYMFVELISDALNEYAYAANLAGLTYSLYSHKCAIFLYVVGYSDKQRILLEKIMDKLTSFKVDPKRFEILKERYVRDLRNFQSEQPNMHASYYLSILLTERVWTKEELLSATEDLTLEGLQAFIPQLLSRFHIESLIHGNLIKQQALELVSIVENGLQDRANTKALLRSQLLKDREIQLPADCNFLIKRDNAIHSSSCVEIYYQYSILESRANMNLELFDQLIREACFNTLRTKEQLGYHVGSGVWRGSSVQGLVVLVQSDRNPQFVDARIEAFLHSMESYLREIPDDEFERHREALVASRLEKPKNLYDQNSKYWDEITLMQYKFDRDNIEVAVLRTLTKDDVNDLFKEFFAHDAQKRHKLAVHVSNPNSPEDTSSGSESCLNGFAPVPPIKEPTLIKDVTEFKSMMSLFPLLSPFIPLSKFVDDAKSKL